MWGFLKVLYTHPPRDNHPIPIPKLQKEFHKNIFVNLILSSSTQFLTSAKVNLEIALFDVVLRRVDFTTTFIKGRTSVLVHFWTPTHPILVTNLVFSFSLTSFPNVRWHARSLLGIYALEADFWNCCPIFIVVFTFEIVSVKTIIRYGPIRCKSLT